MRSRFGFVTNSSSCNFIMIGKKITKEEALKNLKGVVAIPNDKNHYEVYTDLEDFEDLEDLGEGYDFYRSLYHTRISEDYGEVLRVSLTFETTDGYELISMMDYN